MNSPSNFIAEIDIALASKLKTDLEAQGFALTKPNYTIFQAKKEGVSCTLYESGKLMIQGKKKDDFLRFYIEPEILGNLSYSYPEVGLDTTPRIGVDEAGKGDLFGPLCIAALYADEAMINELIKLGIRDSKKLNDAVILKHADAIKKLCPHSLVTIYPKKYNELYAQFKNLNSLLAWGHATSIEELSQKTGCKKVIIDQFASEHVVENALSRKGLELDLSQRHRGEEDLVVAGASILARASFVRGIDRLSDQFHTPLPKGASALVVEAGKKFVAKHGNAPLNEVAKLHFKTIHQITS